MPLPIPINFCKSSRAAAQTAAGADALVTIGIKPTSPQTGFGYIEQGDSIESGTTEEVFRVKSIREKPDFQQALEFVQSGKFYWNSGMFIWRASTILKSISRLLPDLYSGLTTINEALGLPGEKAAIRRIYKNLASISIDYGVMEKADNVYTVPGDFGWSDVGSWDALWEISAKDENGNAFIGGSNVISDGQHRLSCLQPEKAGRSGRCKRFDCCGN